MREVEQWVFTICCGAMLCGVVSVLLPGQGMEKLMNMTLGLFMLCCFLLPAGSRLELPELGLPEAQTEMDETARQATDYFFQDAADRSREVLLGEAAEELQKYGINEKDIQIYIETDEAKDDGSLGLAAQVTLPERLRDRDGELRRVLEERLGVTVRLEYRGEGA